ncbi:MAG: translation elongation factor Ts [Lentisphaeria bacterium]|jgi:elongation factor Ts|nr:translation elongation factor Ts [Lentisphaeria bacterium]
MAEITAALVRELREKTGAGMMDCKKSLVESDGDIQEAIDQLRKSGAVKAAKKAGRSTNEGRITTLLNDNTAVLVEVLCETDFVAKNEVFGEFCDNLAAVAAGLDGEGCKTDAIKDQVKDKLPDLINQIGENIQISRVMRWEAQGKCESYIHAGGKIAVLVDVDGEADEEYLKNLCMHVAAYNPQYISPDDVPAEAVAKEKEIAAATPELADKPEDMLEKILIGKIQKWYKDICLTRQAWVRDDKLAVEKVNPKAKICRFARWQVGEVAAQ